MAASVKVSTVPITAATKFVKQGNTLLWEETVHAIKHSKLQSVYKFEHYNRSTKERCEICPKLTMKTVYFNS